MYIYIGTETKYRKNFKTFFKSDLFELFFKPDKSKFSWLDLLFKQFFKDSAQNECQEKKQQRIYDLLNVKT